MISQSQRRLLGFTGLKAPPIFFGTAALANLPRVIPEQRKLAICGEWFRNVEPPVFIDVAYQDGDGAALEVLSRMLRHLDVAASEVVVHLTLDSNRLFECWEKSCRLLGDDYRPQLVSSFGADVETYRKLGELKESEKVSGIGIVTKDWQLVSPLRFPVDWIVLLQGLSLMHHPAELVASMSDAAQRKVAIVLKGVFGGGFLVGENCLNGRAIDSGDPTNRSLFAWRTAFAALCHGHSVTPAHACIQFALSTPGVVSLALNSSYPDRVAENFASATKKVPAAFWDSMKEEGLLDSGYSFL
jgi:D-threo-aldose 1-dehydrogenase